MALTKRDFVAIAAAIKEVADTPGMDLPTVTTMTSKIADFLQTQNPRFDRGQFIRACLS